MILLKKITGALIAGACFFLLSVVVMVVFGYALAYVKSLQYNFHDALAQGVRSGLYLGAVIAILAFIGTPRRRPPF